MKRQRTHKKPKKTWLKRALIKAGKVLKNHLFPHKGNNHTPHVLKHKALFGYSALLVTLKVITITVSIALPAHSLFSSAITASNITSLTNTTRQNLNLPSLSTNQTLAYSAQMKAEDMLINQYFAHTSPNGTSPWHWFGQAGYSYKYAGENLAVYFTTAEDVHNGWIASPTHKANIVDTRYTEIGIGVAQGEYNGYPATFVVQHFGTPKNSSLATTTETTTQEITEPEAKDDAAPNEETVLAANTEIITTETPKTNNPEPVTIANEPPETVKEPQTITLNDNQVTVLPNPTSNTYEVKVEAKEASKVTAHLGTESITLTPDASGKNWQGNLPYSAPALNDSGETLYVVAAGNDEEVVKPVAVVSPATNTADLYAFANPDNELTFLGIFKVNNLNDNVKQIYVITMVFLGAMLLMTLMAKFHLERLPLVAHSTAVIALAFLLTII